MNREELEFKRQWFAQHWDEIPEPQRSREYRRYKLERRAVYEDVCYNPAKHFTYENFLRSEDREVELIQQEWQVAAAGPQNGNSIYYTPCEERMHGEAKKKKKV